MADLRRIRGSNGDGEAVRATVTAIRSIGSTSLQVDSTTNWEDEFIATTGRIGANDTLDPDTVQVFYGHLAGTNIEIDRFAEGYEDKGNTDGDVVLIKPTTMWANEIADFLATSLKDDGSIAQIDRDADGLVFSAAATQPAPVADKIIVYFKPLEP